jgi:hypothetical protein
MIVWCVQGRLSDLALIVGSGLENDPDSQIAYQFYCYLNLVHVLANKGTNKGLEYSMADLEKTNLIQTKEERKILEEIGEYESGYYQTMVVLAWLGQLFKLCVANGNISDTRTTEFYRQLGSLRASLSGAHEDVPALSWAVTMVTTS